MICAWPMGNRIFPVKLDNSMIVKSVWIGMFFDTVGLFTAENKDYFSRNEDYTYTSSQTTTTISYIIKYTT